MRKAQVTGAADLTQEGRHNLLTSMLHLLGTVPKKQALTTALGLTTLVAEDTENQGSHPGTDLGSSGSHPGLRSVISK